jgi:riboflavin synthase
MFTGIIEELGEIVAFEESAGGARLSVAARLAADSTAEGDSITVNGVCLTVVDLGTHSFSADLSAETLARSTLGGLRPGMRVNLERAVTPSTRLGGHIVQGHVDGRGRLVSIDTDGEFRVMRFWFPEQLARYFIEKGSVAVDGISLTIAALGSETFDVALIPKTWEMTNLATLKPGDEVNLEVDMLAKYVERIMAVRG